MEEEIQIINENTRKEKLKNFFAKNSKYLIFSIAAVIILILAYLVYVEIKSRNHNKIAEKYNNIVNNFNNLKNTEQSTKELIRIIEKKNLTYSPLSLYFILPNCISVFFNNLFSAISLYCSGTLSSPIFFKLSLKNSE